MLTFKINCNLKEEIYFFANIIEIDVAMESTEKEAVIQWIMFHFMTPLNHTKERSQKKLFQMQIKGITLIIHVRNSAKIEKVASYVDEKIWCRITWHWE